MKRQVTLLMTILSLLLSLTFWQRPQALAVKAAPPAVACLTASFSAAANFGTGTGSFPFSVAVGDFNGDSKLDLVTANLFTNNVALLLGNGTGSFGTATSFSMGFLPDAVAAADVSGDGKLDIITADAGDNGGKVSVRLGDGMGGFGARTAFNLFGFGFNTVEPHDIIASDVNGDGKLDLITANFESDNAAVLLNNCTAPCTTPSFASPVFYPTGLNSGSVVAGDVNGDSKRDLVVTNHNSSNVSVLLGNGNGTFQTAVNFNPSGQPLAVTLGDVNGDGKPDLLVANDNQDQVAVLLNTYTAPTFNTSSFGAATSFNTGDHPLAIDTGDFDSDGKLDVVTANLSTSNVTVLLGNGVGSFGTAKPFTVAAGQRWIAVRDFNGDGKPDIVTPTDADNVSVLLNNCQPNQAPTLSGLDQTRTQGTAGSSAQIATANDSEDAKNTLKIEVSSDGTTFGSSATLNNVSVTLTDSDGTAAGTNPDATGKVFATVAANCGATPTLFTLRVTDSGGLTNTSTFIVSIIANPAPTLSYNNQMVNYGNTLMVNVGSVNDNGSIANYSLKSVTPDVPAGAVMVNSSNGVVTVSNNVPAGSYTVVVTATDNCNLGTDASFMLTVNCVVDPVVTNLNDSGAGSLRAAIAAACPNSTITFQNGLTGTMTLTTGELAIDKNLTIQGPGANLVTVQRSTAGGTPNFRIFNITAGDVTFIGLTIANGNAGNSNGGGILNAGTGTVKVTDSTLSDNVVGNSYGSGIDNASTGTVNVTNSTLRGNFAVYGGGGINNASTGMVNVTNCTLSDNSTYGTGGGINNAGTGAVNVTNCTLYSNSSKFGGGINNTSTGTVNVRNTIIALNTASSGGWEVRGALTSLGYNVISKPDFISGFTNGVNNDQVGTIGMPLDAKLTALDNFGGPTPTHRLLPGSPALNKGNNCVLDNTCTPNPLGFSLTTDQRGVTRPFPVNGLVDIGAFEASHTLATTGGTPQSTVVNTSFTSALQVTLTESGQPVSGVQITFGGPGSGASVTFPNGNTATTDSQGRASVNVNANGVTGSYTVNATAPGLTASFNLTNLCATITVAGVQPVMPTCFGGANGSLTVQASGGSAPLQYSINNGQTFQNSNVFTGLAAGSYQAVVRDANNCPSAAFPILLLQPTAIAVTTVPVNPTCFGGANGSLTINATGGTGAFQYSINNGQSFQGSPAFTGLGAGNYQVVVKDANGCPSAAFPVSLSQPTAITLTTVLVNPTCFGGANGSLTINAMGGTGALQYSINSGASFQPSNVFAGLAAGVYPVVVKDANGCPTLSQNVTLSQPTALSLSPSTLPTGVAGQAFTQQFTPNGGTGTKNVNLQGVLPNWLNFNPLNATLSGTPPQPATVSFTLVVTDQANCTARFNYTLNFVCPSLTLAPATLPNGVQGMTYSQRLTTLPAGGNYSYAVTTNVLPPGLLLNSATGELTGTPSASGNYAFVITTTGWANGAANGAGGCSKSQSYNLLITGTCATLTLNPTSLPAGALGTLYSQPLSATGGTAPYTFSLATGALPSGLTLDANSGLLSGTPTASGSFFFTLRVTGLGGCTGSRAYVLNIGCGAWTFDPATLPTGTKGVPYSQQLAVSPAANATFSLHLGNLPPGFTMSSAGWLNGITSQAGTYNFTIKVLVGSCQSTKAYTLVIGLGNAALALSGDYDGDGKSDPALWSAQDGVWRIVRSGNGQAVNQSWGTAGDVTLLGDYDGDGKSDLAVFRPNDATFYIKRSSDGGYLVKQWGLSTDVPVPGDYDGDGRTDIAVWRGTTGTWYVVRSSDGQYEVTAWGSAAAPYRDVPVAGDYDGDGKSDIAVFRRGTGAWFVKRSSDGQYLNKPWGTGTDVPVPGDYDGDGKTDIAVWRGSNGTWYVWQSATNDFRVKLWGTAGDQANAGDYDGDGLADHAIWRGAEQTWYIKCSAHDTSMTKAQGNAGDTPVAPRLNR